MADLLRTNQDSQAFQLSWASLEKPVSFFASPHLPRNPQEAPYLGSLEKPLNWEAAPAGMLPRRVPSQPHHCHALAPLQGPTLHFGEVEMEFQPLFSKGIKLLPAIIVKSQPPSFLKSQMLANEASGSLLQRRRLQVGTNPAPLPPTPSPGCSWSPHRMPKPPPWQRLDGSQGRRKKGGEP